MLIQIKPLGAMYGVSRMLSWAEKCWHLIADELVCMGEEADVVSSGYWACWDCSLQTRYRPVRGERYFLCITGVNQQLNPLWFLSITLVCFYWHTDIQQGCPSTTWTTCTRLHQDLWVPAHFPYHYTPSPAELETFSMVFHFPGWYIISSLRAYLSFTPDKSFL